MRFFALFCFVGLLVSVAEAKRVRTPKSSNARADAVSRKAHGKHVAHNVKTRRSKGAKRERIN